MAYFCWDCHPIINSSRRWLQLPCHTFTVPPSVPWRVIMKSQDNDNGAMVAGGNGVIVPTKHGQQFYLLNLVHLAASFFLVFTAFSGIQVSLRILRFLLHLAVR